MRSGAADAPPLPMGNAIELTAAAAEDPRLEERLRGEPPESRARLLREADGLRGGGETQRRLAATVYRALHEDIDPASSQGAERAAWFVRELRWLHPAAAPLVRRAAACCTDDAARLRARVLAARFCEQDGDHEEADRLLRAVVDAVRGSRTEIEFTALYHLARVAADHEDVARSLAYAARALAAPPRDLAARWTLLTLLCRADAFATIADGARCEREILAAEALVPRLDRAEARARRADLAATRARSHLVRGDAAGAARLLAQALDDGGDGSPQRVRSLHVMGAQAALELGRAEAAAGHLARALRADAKDELLQLEVELVQVRLQRVAGGTASARPRATEFLRRLAAVGSRVVGPDRRARLALAVARILEGPDGDDLHARRAWDLAVSAVLESVSRTVRDADRCPEAGHLSPDDLAALREHAERSLVAHADLERAVARFLESAAQRQGPSFLDRLAGPTGKPTACAWCGRLRGPGGAWLPIAHHLPSEDTLDLTHGICATCAEPLRASLGAASSDAP